VSLRTICLTFWVQKGVQMRQLEPDTDSHIAASPKPALAVARSSPSPNLDISVYDLTGLPGEGSQAPGSSNPVPNPAVVKQPVGKQHILNLHYHH